MNIFRRLMKLENRAVPQTRGACVSYVVKADDSQAQRALSRRSAELLWESIHGKEFKPLAIPGVPDYIEVQEHEYDSA